MVERNRTRAVYLNTTVTLIGQVVQILLGFIVRKIFINTLGIEYLGYNSVFSNILQMLNLVDLGIGVAITSFLYRPLAEGNKTQVSALMYFYKRIYQVMGFVVIALGIIISVFLGKLIPDANCSVSYLRILFFINLLGTASTYFLAYKRTLLIADQKSYTTNIVDTVAYFVMSGLQIFFLLSAPNYIIFLIITIGKNIASNIILSLRVNKEYWRIDRSANKAIVEENKPQIIKYVKEVFVSRIGAVVYYGTDNVIISVIRGSLLAGYLSNYIMITSQLSNIVNQVLSSLQATFGNYINSDKSLKEQKTMTDNYLCVNFCIGNFCMVCFMLLAQPFVKMFFGQTLLLSFSTAAWLAINLMLTILIQFPSQVFIIYKLFRYDRPIIITSAVLNIIISVALVGRMGVDGALIGTFATSLIYLFSRFFIISKFVYRVPYRKYVWKILFYFGISFVSVILTAGAVYNIEGDSAISFGVRAILVGLLAVFISAGILSFTKEFRFLVDKLIPTKFRKFCNKYMISGTAALLIICAAIIGRGTQSRINPTNKSYARDASYVAEGIEENRIFHLSFDDTISCFEDISDGEYDSIFENETFSWFKKIHDEYGVVISCYVQYEDGEFDLSQCTGKYKDEFEENSNWLRFGFHTLDGKTYEEDKMVDDYNKTVADLERIIGSDSIDNVVRLQSFQGSKAGIIDLSKTEEPIVGLLTADDDRQSYYLSEEDNQYIYCHDELERDGITFISTDLRVEFVDNVKRKIKEFHTDAWNNQLGDLVIFSHEWALNYEIKDNIEKFCEYAVDNGYKFEFFEDRIAEKNNKPRQNTNKATIK